MFLLKDASEKEINLTKLTRPLSFWLILLTFIILIFLNSFHIIKTDSLYLEILKEILLTMTGFYFTIRGVEKIAKYKYNQSTQSTQSDSIDPNNLINPDNIK